MMNFNVRLAQVRKKNSKGIFQHSLNTRPFKIVDFKFCYLVNTIGNTGGALDRVLAKIKNEGSKSGNLVTLLDSRGLPYRSNNRSYSMYTSLKITAEKLCCIATMTITNYM